jgi:hypothetical protein
MGNNYFLAEITLSAGGQCLSQSISNVWFGYDDAPRIAHRDRGVAVY